MAFHDVLFPDNIGRGARGGPRRRTQVVSLYSGREERNASWAASRREYDVSFGIRSNDQLQQVVAFFEARIGKLYSFRFKDWSDYKSGTPSRAIDAEDQVLGTGDGSTTEFQLRKLYGTESMGYWRTIEKPVKGDHKVRVALDAAEQFSGWSVDYATGIVTFDTAPASGVVVSSGFEFDVPCRFDTDAIDVTLDIERNGSISSIPLIEVRGE